MSKSYGKDVRRVSCLWLMFLSDCGFTELEEEGDLRL